MPMLWVVETTHVFWCGLKNIQVMQDVSAINSGFSPRRCRSFRLQPHKKVKSCVNSTRSCQLKNRTLTNGLLKNVKSVSCFCITDLETISLEQRKINATCYRHSFATIFERKRMLPFKVLLIVHLVIPIIQPLIRKSIVNLFPAMP